MEKGAHRDRSDDSEKRDHKGHCQRRSARRKSSGRKSRERERHDADEHKRHSDPNISKKPNAKNKWKGLTKRASQNMRELFSSTGHKEDPGVVKNAGKEYDTMEHAGKTKQFFAGGESAKQNAREYIEGYVMPGDKGKNCFATETEGEEVGTKKGQNGALPDYGTCGKIKEFAYDNQNEPNAALEEKRKSNEPPMNLEDYETIKKGQTKQFFAGNAPEKTKKTKRGTSPVRRTDYATLKHGNTTAFFLHK
ncbi:hypothetical protein TTRE_0000756901 [Trichuris trichiura]|uniref:Uncharacterized protein n=1 Tax=Trichuris trichiura TaxID=36087 RepID=A0A077ZI38_TRITR|nr:hypothetical protein TTRE_0000756901 [Trichuris trichiura]